MESPKLALSDAEWQMAAAPDFILTKNRVIDAVYHMFGRLADTYQQSFADAAQLYPEVGTLSPKISRGEKYEAMPWVMLDYPRCFLSTQGHFAIRTFFWWGHYFSLQLQVSGNYLEKLIDVPEKLAASGWYAGFTTEPWNFELPNKNWVAHLPAYRPNSGEWYGKVAKKIPINEWVQAEQFLNENYRMLVRAIANQG